MSLLFNIALEVLAKAIRQGKERKNNQIGREEVKFICKWHDIIYLKNPKDHTKKLLGLINKFSQFAGYQINIKKCVVFLYTNNELAERKRERERKKGRKEGAREGRKKERKKNTTQGISSLEPNL